ncbi:hypothetical protein BCR34DRAFT_21174 [Clohesyomyces aquaticus]|uniref:Secreted protein n=1 Tax=Clohesyomyces aquaticus TaxID=1231657 RepID=A0A1Y1ZB46_9PLEO|nr:hypothetical protein BCR34DRAFT_21174 [Clohesyomyces aquaticus]
MHSFLLAGLLCSALLCSAQGALLCSAGLAGLAMIRPPHIPQIKDNINTSLAHADAKNADAQLPSPVGVWTCMLDSPAWSFGLRSHLANATCVSCGMSATHCVQRNAVQYVHTVHTVHTRLAKSHRLNSSAVQVSLAHLYISPDPSAVQRSNPEKRPIRRIKILIHPQMRHSLMSRCLAPPTFSQTPKGPRAATVQKFACRPTRDGRETRVKKDRPNDRS